MLVNRATSFAAPETAASGASCCIARRCKREFNTDYTTAAPVARVISGKGCNCQQAFLAAKRTQSFSRTAAMAKSRGIRIEEKKNRSFAPNRCQRQRACNPRLNEGSFCCLEVTLRRVRISPSAPSKDLFLRLESGRACTSVSLIPPRQVPARVHRLASSGQFTPRPGISNCRKRLSGAAVILQLRMKPLQESALFKSAR